MGNAGMDDVPRRVNALVQNTALPATQIGGRPTLEAWVEVCSVDGVEEKRVVDGIKSLTNVHGDHCRTKRWLVLVEAGRDSLGDRQEGGGGGTILGETVLSLGLGKRGSEEREKEAFEDFGGRA